MLQKRLLWLWLLRSCGPTPQHSAKPILTGAAQPEAYLPLLKDKKVALLVNQTSQVEQEHLVDRLLKRGIKIQKVFAPEHGFRGDKAAAEAFKNSKDPVTNLPIISLYGKVKEPTKAMLEDVDIVVFDIQDVGVRCYTYLSTLHHMMHACATHKVPLLVLDRPNPNGHYVDGPVLDTTFQSFVGKHPIPIVHGMTLGELAGMINGEGWLQDKKQCDLKVIHVAHYTHKTPYTLPIPPSPNLPNAQAIALYPHLVLFEGTTISTARGTPFPFQAIGYPNKQFGPFQFIPISLPGKAFKPKHQGELCFGIDLRKTAPPHHLQLQYLIQFYEHAKAQGISFFGPTFDIHAGSDRLRKQLEAGLSEDAIRTTWQKDLKQYEALRQKYLLYD